MNTICLRKEGRNAQNSARHSTCMEVSCYPCHAPRVRLPSIQRTNIVRPKMTAPGSPFDLTGSRALVTGSSRGLGLAMARALAEAGAEIILNARDTTALGAAAADFAAAGHKVNAVAFDVTSRESVN